MPLAGSPESNLKLSETVKPASGSEHALKAPEKTTDAPDHSPLPNANKAFLENNPWVRPEPEPDGDVDQDAAGRQSIVSGNGLGYAVLGANGELRKFYAHPYRYERPSADLSKEGVPTYNFVQSLTWSNPSTSAGLHETASAPQDKMHTSYVSESNVMRVSGQNTQQSYFMPFGLNHNALITTATGANTESGAVPQLIEKWSRPVDKEEQINVAGRDIKWVSFQNTPESIAMISLGNDGTKSASKNGVNEQGWALIALESKNQLQKAVSDFNAWQNNLGPSELTAREIKNQDAWRVKPNVSFQSDAERRVWRESETVLRMGQITEENNETRKNNGLINASLPDGEWFIPWVRDMSYSINGLTEMGHTAEARKGLMAYFNAGPMTMQPETRGKDYQISVVRYYGNGAEEADYSGEKSPNVELDNWGLVLWTASEYYRKTQDKSFLQEQTKRGSVYESMRDYVVNPLIANLDKQGSGSIVTADSSLWEEHQQNKKHFAFDTIMAIRGLRGFLPIAQAMHDKDTVDKVGKTITELEKGFADAYIDQKTLRGSLEKSFAHDIDGSVIEAFNLDVVKDPEVLENTLKKMELLREPSGGFRRVRGDTNYERQEFLMINFYMARLYFKLGRNKEGMDLLTNMVNKADADNGRVPEMYVSEKNDEFVGKIGTPTGAIPMVGYGAGAYVMTLEEREHAKGSGKSSTP